MEAQDYKNIGRNDPCPCGSGKKFKKCHADSAEAAAWHGNEKPQTETSAEGGEAAPQFDPSKMDLNWLAEFSSAIQRLPKGQMQQLQALMQKAMAGKDVARELDEFQRKLPTNVQELLTKSPELNQQFENAQAQAQAGKGTPTSELTEEQRAKLIEIQKNNEKSGLSRLWNKFRGK